MSCALEAQGLPFRDPGDRGGPEQRCGFLQVLQYSRSSLNSHTRSCVSDSYKLQECKT